MKALSKGRESIVWYNVLGAVSPVLASAKATEGVEQEDKERMEETVRGDDACETTLNPGFKWVRWASIGLPATRRTCTPGDVAHPWS
jgi:hypothetical protein